MIDYNLIDRSIQFYNDEGFQRIEVPWMVTEYVDSITRPEGVEPYRVESKNKNFVASGEQGFLYLYLKEYLPKGRFQTVTPCMRNDSFDYTHTKYFIKNELIITDDTSWKAVQDITEMAMEFFRSIFSPAGLKRISRENGYDIEYKGTELGSYGVRECKFLKWVYGTGCAEPRTSKLWGTTQER